MAPIRLSTTSVIHAVRYTLQTDPQQRVGGLARYLSQQESGIDVSTLEHARLLGSTEKLYDLDYQAGDRLLLLVQPPQSAELPAALQPGERTLKIKLGDTEFQSRGRHQLVAGRPDDFGRNMPDIDLRYVVQPRFVKNLSREALKLNYDERRKTWYAQRSGQTRILLGELELSSQPIPLEGRVNLAFYRANVDPRDPDTSPMGELTILVETVERRADRAYLSTGNESVPIIVGIEREILRLTAAEHVDMDYITSCLLARAPINGATATKLYLLRLLPPSLSVHDLNLQPDEILYSSRRAGFMRNALVLYNTTRREQNYEVLAGAGHDIEYLVGRRSAKDTPEPELDVDLFDAVIAREPDIDTYKRISRRQARIFHRGTENTWWIQLEDRASVPGFINNVRLTNNSPALLTSGDVITFGSSVERAAAQLEVEIQSKME